MIIVDDGDITPEKECLYDQVRRIDHGIAEVISFDSGFGRKSNRIAEWSTRPYLLIGSDDFEFSDYAAHGILDMQKMLDNCPDIDIVSGRVNFKSYEFYLDIKWITTYIPGYYIKERPVFDSNASSFTMSHVRGRNGEILTPEFFYCDLTVNYSLIRMSSFRKAGIKWDNDVKIGGGEHGAFFFDCKRAGLKTVCVPSANINEQKIKNSPRYNEYRRRALLPDRPCFDKRQIVEYVLGDGRVDYKRQYGPDSLS
jgi:hypothetical protein